MSKKRREQNTGADDRISPPPDAGEAADPAAVPDTAGAASREEPAGAPTTDEIEALRDQLADLQTEVAEQVDRRLRLAAELDNLRKRSRREVDDARRFAQADLLRPLLEVLDNFERALRSEPGDAGDGALTQAGDEPGSAAPDAFRQGVELIAQSFRQTLRDCGVRRIETEGRAFDPALHEAVGQTPAPDGVASGSILTEVQSGYTFDDLVLRASRVIVAH